MTCLTLIQPFGSLLVAGLKKIETRPRRWHPRGDGWVGIHAGKSVDYLDLCADEPFKSALAKIGIRGPADLPMGAILGAGKFRHCYRSEELICGGGLTAQELAFGDYTQGRYGYVFDQMLRFRKPIPARGMQGPWPWKPGGIAGHELKCPCLRSGAEIDCTCASLRVFLD